MIATKPMFREAFKSKRCLIPASGYYEWHDAGHVRWLVVELEEQGERRKSAIVHDGDHGAEQVRRRGSRSDAVILEPKDFEQWEQGDAMDAAALMKPAGEDV